MSTDPYLQTGRRNQKARTRDALIDAARELLAQGIEPTVEDAAQAAAISRTTAYRYFPNKRQLLVAAHPEIEHTSVLPENPPTDPRARLEIVLRAATGISLAWEPQLRATLRLSLEPGHDPTGPVLRRGRVIGWIEDALSPLADTTPDLDRHQLAVAIRAATGIESLIWLVDVAGLARADAARAQQWTGLALLHAALADRPPSACET
ncbi:MAG: TetR/AcrR family transcriptional regulator [Pseudonocardia sp.]|nr:TetR/AcrR family transcriptional regulator [Pseudonocardia sp.]